MRALSRRRKIQEYRNGDKQDLHDNGYERNDFVVSDGEGQSSAESDDKDDAFEPVREAGKRARSSRKRQLGPPITIDEKLDTLSETHRLVVEDFVHHAKREIEKASLRLFAYDQF